MRATSVLSLLFLILGQICKSVHEPFLDSSLTMRFSSTVLPTFATPVGQDAPMQIKRNYGVANKMASLVGQISFRN
jgi:hypothetical protein